MAGKKEICESQELNCSKKIIEPIKENFINLLSQFDENAALLTHYFNITNPKFSKKYEDELLKVYSIKTLQSFKKKFKKQEIKFKARKKTKFTFIDLFAGIGGFRIAMQNCGGECVFSSEWDNAAKQTYYENYREIPFGDITKSEIKELIPENFDVLCAGFPCQAFSIAGYQKGFEDVRGTLFFDVADIIEHYRPKAFFLENVKNLKSHDEGRTYTKIKDILENRLGYKVHDKIMNPCEYANIPQNRERIFIIGFDSNQINNVDEFEFPSPIKLSKTIHDIIDYSIINEHLFYKKNSLYYDRIKDFIKSFDTVYQWRRVYVRENKSHLCPTLTANMGMGGHNVPIILTPKGIRKLSPIECLRFQGFPLNYVFPASLAESKKYKQVGNSVTAPLIELVANKMIDKLF